MGRTKSRKTAPPKPKSPTRTNLVEECLKPYLSLLPDISTIGTSAQKALHEALYNAGCSAAQALEAYLREKPASLKKSGELTSDSDELRALLSYVSAEMSSDDLKRVCMGEDGKLLLRDKQNRILNEVAAAALSAFTFAAARHSAITPVEYMMNPTASVEVPGDGGSQTSTILSADPKGGGSCASGGHGEHHYNNPFHCSRSRKLPPSQRLKVDLVGEDSYSEYADGSDADLDGSEITDNVDDDLFCGSMDCCDALLRFSCTVGNVELVRELINIRGSPNYTHSNRCTTLMEACCTGQLDVVKELLQAGANVNATTHQLHNTPLIYASTAGRLDVVKELLKQSTIAVDLRNTSGHTALMEASGAGHLDIVKELVKHKADIFAVVENVDFKESSLSLASYRGHVHIVKYLISAMPNSAERLEELHTGLLEAAMDGHVEVAKVLLEGGAPINLPTENFESPLTLASCGGHLTLIKLLVERGADLEEPNDEGYTPLMEAAREGHIECVEYLLDKGANVNTKIDDGVETALTLAASGGYLNVVELLVRRGANLFVGERSPIHEATQEGHAEVVKYLIDVLMSSENKAAAIQDLNNGLVCAAETNNMFMINFFLEHGAHCDGYSKEGRTALMEAARHGYLQVMEYLLAKGADPNRSSPSNDATALSLSCLYGQPEATRVLLEHGADPLHILKDSVSCIIEACRNGSLECATLLLDRVAGTNSARLSTPSEINSRPKIKPVSKINGLPVRPAAQRSNANHQPILSSSPNAESRLSDCARTEPLPGRRALSQDPRHSSSKLTTNSADKSMTAHFLHHALVEPKKKDDWTVAELNCFKQLIKHKIGTLCSGPGSQSVPEQELMMTNVMNSASSLIGLNTVAESTNCPSCNATHNVAKYSRSTPVNQYTAALLNAVHNARSGAEEAARVANSVFPYGAEDPAAATLLPSAATSKRKALLKTPKNSLNVDVPSAALSSKQTSGSGQQSLTSQHLSKYDCSTPPIPSDASQCLHHQHTKSAAVIPNPVRATRRATPHGGSPDVGGGRRTTSASSSAPPPPTEHSQNTDEENRLVSYVDSQTESNNDTALTVACVGGHDALVSMLIQKGANVEHRDKKGFTPLILAATGGHLETCRLLIDAGCTIDAQSERTKDTALSLACSGGRKEVVDLLLTCGANKEHRNVSDYTPLSLAASGGYVEIISLLLNAGAEINSRTGSKLGISPLMLAAMNGHEQATLLLLERGSDINAQIETNRNTALTLACFQGRTEVVRLLLKYGANVEHRAKTGLTPLMEAANGGYTDVGRLLLRCKADPNAAPVPTSRDTALTISADKGHSEFVSLLLTHGANVDARNKKGCTSLFLASNNGHIDTVKVLITNGADPDCLDHRKTSPLMAAFRKGHVEVVEFLVKHVSQFPSDQECLRFYNTLTDREDVATRVKQCIGLVSEAKLKQAEQADKAADDLIQLLEQEEKIAKSKEETKKRQKEKKKAKKLAKKMQEIGDGYDDVEDDKLEPPPEEPEPVQDVQADEVRVPAFIPVRLEEIAVSPQVTTKVRRQSRRQRNESNVSSSVIVSPQPSPAFNGITKLMSATTISDENEWHSATTKKRTSSRPGKTNGTKENSISSGGDIPCNDFKEVVQITHGNPNIYDTINLTEPGSRRRIYALVVNSSTVARIIGRAGQNINAIREATGGHIEVEKIATRREQSTRQITVKGTADISKLAIHMIDQLIRDSDSHVSDIIRRLVRSESQSSQTSLVKPLTPPNVSSSVNTSTWQKKTPVVQHNPVSTQSLSSISPPSGSLPPHAQSVSESPASSPPPSPHGPQAPVADAVPLEQVDEEPIPATELTTEDLRRKAPGFDRPLAQHKDLQKPGHSGVNSPFGIGDGKLLDLAGILKDASLQLPGSDSIGLQSPTSAMISSLTASAAQASSEECKPRPLSEIWDNRSLDSASQPDPISIGYNGIFGNSLVDSKTAALWCPSDEVTPSSKDDTWTTATSIFGGIDAANGVEGFIHKRPADLAARPHSSTDWNNAYNQAAAQAHHAVGWGNDAQWSKSVDNRTSQSGADSPIFSQNCPSPSVQTRPSWESGNEQLLHQLALQLGNEKEKARGHSVNNLPFNYNQNDDNSSTAHGNGSQPRASSQAAPVTSTSSHPTVLKSYLDSMKPNKDFEMPLIPNPDGTRAGFFNQVAGPSANRHFAAQRSVPTHPSAMANQNGLMSLPGQAGNVFFQRSVPQGIPHPPSGYVQPPPGFHRPPSGVGQAINQPPPPPFFGPQVGPPNPAASLSQVSRSIPAGFMRNGNVPPGAPPQPGFAGAAWPNHPNSINPPPQKPFASPNPTQWNNWNY